LGEIGFLFFRSSFCIELIFRKFEVNIWSSFEIKGNPDMTLEGFIKEVEVSLKFFLLNC
jgi:hypothetical protein